MQRSQDLLDSLGKLIQSKRSISMDQQELAARVGLGRNTISSMENGKAVSSESLFKVLDHLDLLSDIQAVVDNNLSGMSNTRNRKSRKQIEILNNDF
jgi:DNA-binding XRE family transcriptional regulator